MSALMDRLGSFVKRTARSRSSNSEPEKSHCHTFQMAAGVVFIRTDESDGLDESGGRAGLGDGEREANCHADRPERRVDHPQGHHAADPADPAPESRPRRLLRRRRVRGLFAPEREGPCDCGGRRGPQEGLVDRSLLPGARIAPRMADKKPTKADLTAVPIQHLDLEKTQTIADLVDGYKHISFQARTLGLCASVLENMMTDPKCTVFFGGAGALTPGGLKKVMRDMVEFALVYIVLTTGATPYHDSYDAHRKHHHDRVKKGKEPIALDSIKDNYEIAQVKLKSPRTGVFYVGGGTPKNYISQVEVIQEVMGYPENPHMYAAQITTDVPQWGGLSGCTFEESQSWGKFHKDAKMAQSLVDATIGLPILVGYLLQKGVAKRRKQKRYKWEGEELLELK